MANEKSQKGANGQIFTEKDCLEIGKGRCEQVPEHLITSLYVFCFINFMDD